MLSSCSTCAVVMPTAYFPKKGETHTRLCRPCRNGYMRQWNAAHRDVVTARHRDYKLKNPDAYKSSHLKTLFGIDLAEYRRLLDAQGGVCAICLEPERAVHNRTRKSKLLAVDHCHVTGAVRGLLCSGCNTALGSLDTPELLDRASAYLKKGMA